MHQSWWKHYHKHRGELKVIFIDTDNFSDIYPGIFDNDIDIDKIQNPQYFPDNSYENYQ